MSAFREVLMGDVNTFINPDELASQHNINGCEITCVLGAESRDASSPGQMFGTDEADTVLYVGTGELRRHGIKLGGYGSHLRIDGEVYTVIRRDTDNGMEEIALSARESE